MRDGYEISTDRSRLNLDVIHGFLSTEAYWSPGVPREVTERAIANSIPFGVFAPDGSQAGFARVVTDRAIFAYIADVFILPEHRSRKLGVLLIQTILEHPDLQGLRRIELHTLDAHGLYEQCGFAPPVHPGRAMEILRSAEELYRI
ncbi:MAG: GNAT family N-acetyltransferase [Solirubrobacteraceae bacterium]|nr:GNAT family N-acetyltransferase [Solirubrobacteraceae bacterium]